MGSRSEAIVTQGAYPQKRAQDRMKIRMGMGEGGNLLEGIRDSYPEYFIQIHRKKPCPQVENRASGKGQRFLSI